MKKLWPVYVSITTDKVYDRIFFGYVLSETSEEAMEKLEKWKQNKNPYDFLEKGNSIYKFKKDINNVKNIGFYVYPVPELEEKTIIS